MTLAAWLHNLDPYAIRLWGDFGIRWYGLSYAAGFVIAWLVLRALARRGRVLIPPQRVGDAIITMALGAVVGGRLGYVLIYRPELLWTFTPRLPWWGVLDIASGGMASHGGIVGVILAAWRVSKGWKSQEPGIGPEVTGDAAKQHSRKPRPVSSRHPLAPSPSPPRYGRVPLLHVLDCAALVAPFGLFLGRVANFINGELLGAPVAAPGRPSPWWSVKFPQEVLSEHAPDLSHEQVERLLDLANRAALPSDEGFEAKYGRLVERIQNGAGDLARELEPLLSARYPSQLFQAAAEGIVLGAVLCVVWRRPLAHGVVGCWFLIAYGAMRILTEVWRLPDGHLQVARIAGLTRGQWLSAAMIVAGFAFLVPILRRARAPER